MCRAGGQDRDSLGTGGPGPGRGDPLGRGAPQRATVRRNLLRAQSKLKFLFPSKPRASRLRCGLVFLSRYIIIINQKKKLVPGIFLRA